MSNLRKVISQTGWQTVAKAFSALSTLILISLISRNYGDVGIGVFTLSTTYLAFFNLAADLGLNGYVLGRMESDSRLFEVLTSFRFFISIFLVIISIVLFPFMPFYSNIVWIAVVFGSFSIILNSFFLNLSLLNQKNLKYSNATISTALGSLVTVLCGVLFVYFRFPVQFVVLSVSLGMLANSIVGYRLLRGSFEINFRFDFGAIVRVFVKAWPVSATLIINTLYFRVDTFILSSYFSLSDVGVYNLAYSIFQDCLVIPTFIMNGYYPLMLEHFKASMDIFFKDFRKAVLGMLGLGSLGGVLTYLLAPLAIYFVTGVGDGVSVAVLQILSFSLPAFFLSALLIWTFMTMGLFKRMLVIYCMGFLVNVTLNILLIPKYSYWAASWVTVVSEYLILVLQIIILIPAIKKYRTSK